MAEPSTHINYSFEDIQRYLQNKMSAAEMHDIEKAALQDPFLADAIEGFNDVDATVAQQHLNDINISLLKKKDESKVVAFNKKTQWLNVAAVIIVLTGIGLVGAYFFRSSDKQTQIAQVKNEAPKSEALKDSVSNDNVAALASKQPDTTLLIAENKAVKKLAPLAMRKIVTENKDVEVDKAEEKNVDDVASVAAAPVQSEASNDLVMDTIRNNIKSARAANSAVILQDKVSGLSVLPTTFSGKVVDVNNKPITGALIQSADKKNAVLTDMNGNFSLQKNDTSLNIIASTLGYTSASKKLKTGYNAPIILQGTNDNLNEVVVTAMGIDRKRKALRDSAQPIGGWKNFNNYVMMQLNKDTTLPFTNNPADLVEMEFLVDQLGNPYDIRVTKSLDDAHTSKAIDILKNGPKWTNTSRKKKAKVSIAF